MTTVVRPGGTRPGTGRAGLRGVARGGALNLVGATVSGLAGLAVTAMVARGLGHGLAGAFFAATSAFLLAQMVAKLGADTGLVYWLARLRALGRHDLLHRCLRICLAPVLVASLVAAAALFMTAPTLAHLPALTGHAAAGQIDDFVRAVRILAVFLPLAVCSDALLAATRGYRTMRPTALAEKVIRPALQLVLLAGALLAASTTADILAWAIPYAVSVALAAGYLSAIDRRRGERAAGDEPSAAAAEPVPARLATAFWRFTAPRALSSIAQSALQRLDVLLVAGLLGLPAAAAYTVATRFIVVAQLANQAIGSAVQPRLAELLARRDVAAVGALYRAATGWVVLLVWPICLLVAVFAPTYLSVFGAGYADGGAARVVAVLCLAMLLASGCGMVDMVLTMGGRTTWNLANVALALAVNLTLDVLLIPPLGIGGAALGWAIALAVKNLVPLVQIRFALDLHPFGRATATAALLAVGCVGLPATLIRLIGGGRPADLLVALAVAAPCYLAGCYLLRGYLQLPTPAIGRRSLLGRLTHRRKANRCEATTR